MKFPTRLDLFSVAAVLVTAGMTAAHAQTFTPLLTSTVGSGSKESFFTLDFQDGTANDNYAFGYKYDGAKTGADFLAALSAGTPLQIDYVPGYTPTSGSYLGVAVNGFTFNGHSEAGFENAYYWSYWLGTDGQNWTYSGVGASSRDLSNGSWDGWSWDVNGLANGGPFDSLPVTPAAVPEASSAVSLSVLALLGVGVFAIRRSRKPSAL